MSDIKQYYIGEACYLSGQCFYTAPDYKSLLNLVVIVDDNSGSMGGKRQKYCIEKSQAIVAKCIASEIPYQYST